MSSFRRTCPDFASAQSHGNCTKSTSYATVSAFEIQPILGNERTSLGLPYDSNIKCRQDVLYRRNIKRNECLELLKMSGLFKGAAAKSLAREIAFWKVWVVDAACAMHALNVPSPLIIENPYLLLCIDAISQWWSPYLDAANMVWGHEWRTAIPDATSMISHTARLDTRSCQCAEWYQNGR